MIERVAIAASALCLLAGCGGAGNSVNTGGVQYDTSLPEAAEPGQERDAPEISRGVGVPGGVVVLWPRIVQPRSGSTSPDAATHAAAAQLQKRIAGLVAREFPGVPVDMRPEPERVCPRSGCAGASVGVLLSRSGRGGCVALALVSGSGTSPARLIPWAGMVRLDNATVPFREPPESQVHVKDNVDCDKIEVAALAHDAEVVAAIRTALGK